MPMTHYMELLAQNQPWNLILFMAIPVILAETVAITELFILLLRSRGGWLRALNRLASILAGVYFLGVFAYLLPNVVVPLTLTGQWRGMIDMIAVGFYLSGAIPLAGLALLDLGVLARSSPEERKLFLHALLVAAFLVLSHVAMIFGMMNPYLIDQDAAHMPTEHMMNN